MKTQVAISSPAAVVYALRPVEGGGHEVLLVRRAKGDYLDNMWLHISGGIEAGETAWQAALRELQEETALVPESFYSTSFCENFYSFRNDAIFLLPVFVAFVVRAAQVRLNSENNDYAWVSFEKAYGMLPFRNQIECLAMVEDYFIKRPPHETLKIDIGSPDHAKAVSAGNRV